MKLILILGPMKSGQSLELISYFAPLKYSKTSFALFHPQKNVRDEMVWSRNGLALEAKKIESLKDLAKETAEVIGIDEIHMFDPAGIAVIDKMLKEGKKFVISGLDLDHQKRLMPIVHRLLELGPDEIRYKRAVCEKCQSYEAVFTQIFQNGEPIPKTMPASIPDDGTYEYVPVCRTCYK